MRMYGYMLALELSDLMAQLWGNCAEKGSGCGEVIAFVLSMVDTILPTVSNFLSNGTKLTSYY